MKIEIEITEEMLTDLKEIQRYDVEREGPHDPTFRGF